ncbi:MAG: hypothetical protein WAO02_16540 [Verrucomicrobiia bacterium]
MNLPSDTPATRRPARRLWLWALLAAPLLLLILLGTLVANCFCLPREARVLRNELILSSGVKWQQKIALNADTLTLGAVRAGLSFVRLAPEARAVVQSVRSAGVGVYQLASGTRSPDRAAMLVAADSAMSARGWERAVGVMDGHDLVAVYVPKENSSARRVKCCVMVFDGKEMVLVSARGNLEPLLQYAFEQPGFCAQLQHLAQR